MNKIVLYWSGTGNTESMAQRIAGDLGCEAKSITSTFVDEVVDNDIFILGCPSMGSEELEDSEFRPFFEDLMSKVSGKKFALFGSYGWGDGEWMRNWQDEVVALGGELLGEGLIANGDTSAIDDAQYQEFLSNLQ